MISKQAAKKLIPLPENPLVSVIIPSYNSRQWVGKAIDSVLAQTCRDFELIVWDDGSSDDSGAVVASYRDPRLRAFAHRPNCGLFPTLNLALGECRADLAGSALVFSVETRRNSPFFRSERLISEAATA